MAALYFKEEFELSTEAAVASTFGWMNLFARGLGGSSRILVMRIAG